MDEGGKVVLRPIALVPLREYTGEDMEMFARENEMTADVEDASTPCSNVSHVFTGANVHFSAVISPRG